MYIATYGRIMVRNGFEATGFIGTRLHIVVFCIRNNAIRIISLRKANSREVRAYYEDQNTRGTIS